MKSFLEFRQFLEVIYVYIYTLDGRMYRWFISKDFICTRNVSKKLQQIQNVKS